MNKMSEVDKALNYIPLNEEGTDVTCGHGSRWIYWHQEKKWIDVVRRSDCKCADPPSPDIIKQVAVDAENIEKYAPFWVRSIFKGLEELYGKYELLVGEIGDLQNTEPVEEADKAGVSFYESDELAEIIKDDQRVIDEIIQALIRETGLQPSDMPVMKRRIL